MTKNLAPEMFSVVEVEKPSIKIVKQIRHLISIGALQKGDRLPSERELCERFGVGRGYVREALKELEFCGILSTTPQSGTVIVNTGLQAMSGLIANMLEFEEKDWPSLLEVRAVLEANAVWLATKRVTEKQKEELKKCHEAFTEKVKSGDWAMEEDLAFHLMICEFSGNPILRSIVGIIAPDILAISRARKTCSESRVTVALAEHERILNAILEGDADRAAAAMQSHMSQASVSITGAIIEDK